MAGGPRRSTIEVMVLLLTATVCGALLLVGGGIVVIEVVNPQADTTVGVTALSTTISTLAGAVLGLIAGHSTRDKIRERPDGDDDG